MGLLVDASVVVIESIHRHQRLGMSAEDAAREGARSVALPMLASSLATVAASCFRSAGSARGSRQKAFHAAGAYIVAVSVFAGLHRRQHVAVTPVASSLFPRPQRATWPRAESATTHRPHRRWIRERLTALALPRRRLVLGCIALLVAASVVGAASLPSTFFPEIDESMDTIYVRFSPGISVKEAGARLAAMAKALSAQLLSSQCRRDGGR